MKRCENLKDKQKKWTTIELPHNILKTKHTQTYVKKGDNFCFYQENYQRISR